MSDVIKLDFLKAGICLMTLQDRESSNAFSDELIQGLREAFQEIKNNSELKVVLATGYDTFFCCGGGTEASLLELTKGEINVAELDYFKLPLECEIPTIAAAQGHALGGGLSFSCFFDHLILSAESYYGANFMKYGFTPGMGSTYSIPQKFGDSLGREMLFTAQEYSGKELLRRNPCLLVYPREQVLEKALQLASKLSDKTLTSLKLLKKSYADRTRRALLEIFKVESEMHAQTITTEEARARIKEQFQKMKK